MHQLVAGKTVHVQTTAAGELLLLRYFPGGSEQLVMEKSGGAFKVSEQAGQSGDPYSDEIRRNKQLAVRCRR